MSKQPETNNDSADAQKQKQGEQPLKEVEKAEADLRDGKLGDHLPGSSDRLQG